MVIQSSLRLIIAWPFIGWRSSVANCDTKGSAFGLGMVWGYPHLIGPSMAVTWYPVVDRDDAGDGTGKGGTWLNTWLGLSTSQHRRAVDCHGRKSWQHSATGYWTCCFRISFPGATGVETATRKIDWYIANRWRQKGNMRHGGLRQSEGIMQFARIDSWVQSTASINDWYPLRMAGVLAGPAAKTWASWRSCSCLCCFYVYMFDFYYRHRLCIDCSVLKCWVSSPKKMILIYIQILSFSGTHATKTKRDTWGYDAAYDWISAAGWDKCMATWSFPIPSSG